MITLWRLAQKKFSDLSGNGGLYTEGRWHKKGHRIVYTAQNESLALLENLVHFDRTNPPENLALIQISVNTKSILDITDTLPEKWSSNQFITQDIGTQWLSDKTHLILKVPSVITSTEYNYLINPEHSLFSKAVNIIKSSDIALDQRLM